MLISASMTFPKPLSLSLLFFGLLLGSQCSARANEFSCKPSVEETTYLHAHYLLPAVNIHQLRGELESWADEQGIERGGSGSYDPKTGVHEWGYILGRKGDGVSITLRFRSNSNRLNVVVENVCWEDQQDWHPLWKVVDAELLKRGYRRQPEKVPPR